MIGQMFQAFAAIPTLVSLLQEQMEQISAIRAELRTFQNNQSPASDPPEGYIDPKILAAIKYVSIKQAAFLLNMSDKSVRRLIQRGQLTTSKGMRVKRIPVEAIEAYKAKTL